MKHSETKNKKNKLGLIIAGFSVAALALTGIGVASAVALGITANNELGAGSSVTATCQPVGTNMTVGFSTPTYVPATKTFSVASVKLGSIAVACNGLNVKIVVADSAGVSLGEVTGAISGTTYSGTLPAAVNSANVASVNVVVYGS